MGGMPLPFPPFRLVILSALLLGSVAPSSRAQQPPSKLGLVTSYQHEKLELTKRDIALKMIDSGLLKLGETTAEDVAKIFGKDWNPDLGADGQKTYGIIRFSNPEPSADPQPYYGWYMVVYYGVKDRKVFDWDLSNVHK